LNINVKVIATSASILSNEALSISLINSPLQLELLVPELTSQIKVSSLGSHTESNHKSALDELVRVVSQNFSIFTCAGLGLVTVHDEVGGAAVGNLRHEGVLETARETCTTSATETGLFDLVNDPVWAIQKDVLGLMPVTLYSI
jgi:hypothetical protein